MAIHPLLPGLEVTIQADHEGLYEYEFEEGQLDEVTYVRYIEAVSNAQIKVSFSFLGNEFPLANQSIAVEAHLDSGGHNSAWVTPVEITRSVSKTIAGFWTGSRKHRAKYDMHFSALDISTFTSHIKLLHLLTIRSRRRRRP
jgi:hypothetical protein